MARIIDLSNGYGRLEGYPSKCGSLTFPLNQTRLRRLHVEGYLSDVELWDILTRMGYCQAYIKWVIALDKVEWARAKERLKRARTI